MISWNVEAAVEAATTCTLNNCFDVTKAAQAFSQFAGVLTGFAFAAFFLAVQRVDAETETSGRKVTLRRPIVGLLASVAMLAVTTFTYSVVAGVEGPGNKAQSLYLVATAVFGMSGTTLIFSVWLILDDTIEPVAARTLRPGISVLVLVLYGYVVVTAADVSDKANQIGEILHKRMIPLWLGLPLLLILAVFGIRRPVTGRSVYDVANWIPLLSLAASMVTVGIFAPWIAGFPLDGALPLAGVYAIVLLSLLVCGATLMAIDRSPMEP